ncbi:hypothetical protein VTN96DRAFT_4275 [Rasamsonia emersonii]|uniref:Uncharacterized protein n=1 Tax=Rasamsonia emersonii (strain ATCC 16479 / CBS 393.64 / IMI 116815) TaxID=1408163 RepID=A0A0F4Z161_RASE3|nr:hypothetical protein T310_2359 [Rasamsonia emersonii CBS 393.64]KKA23613.1 hypothetical protein T310_2359 [Rasamsonia emersonii CBS 393.64]
MPQLTKIAILLLTGWSVAAPIATAEDTVHLSKRIDEVMPAPVEWVDPDGTPVTRRDGAIPSGHVVEHDGTRVTKKDGISAARDVEPDGTRVTRRDPEEGVDPDGTRVTRRRPDDEIEPMGQGLPDEFDVHEEISRVIWPVTVASTPYD